MGSKILRVCIFLLGALCFAYGFMLGILGADAEGPHNSIYIRILGIYVLILGASYIFSNESKMKTRKKYLIHMFFEFTPLIVLLVATIYSISSEGFKSFVNTGGHLTVTVLAFMSLISPLSLVAANKEKSSNLGIE